MARIPVLADLVLNNDVDADDIIESHSRPNAVIPSSQYQPIVSLRENYLLRTNISQHYQEQLARVLTGQSIDASRDWILSRDFYQGALGTASNMLSLDRNFRHQFTTERATGLFNEGVAEYMQFFEVVLYRILTETSRSLAAAGNIDANSFRYCQQLMCQPRERINQTIRQLFYHFNVGSELNEVSDTRWSKDFRKIIEMTIEMIQRSFAAQENHSDFLDLMPSLKTASVRRNRIRHWTWELQDRPTYLSLLFAITMIRFPSTNTKNPQSYQMKSVKLYYQKETSPNLVLKTTYYKITDANLKSIFYFVPEMNRVFGIFPKSISVRNDTDDDPRHFVINYKMNLIRNIVVIVDIPIAMSSQNYQISLEHLFSPKNDNLYKQLRMTNPFALPDFENSRRRLYVSLTIYANQDATVLHVPFILEGALNDSSPFLVDTFCNEWERVLFNTNSGDGVQERIRDINQFAFYFCFILDPSLPLASDHVAAPLVQRPRVTRSQTSRARSTDGMVVGAPYAGTKKEKHFLEASLIDRFRNSNAIFKTPQRRMHSCLMMSLLKCQLYHYEFVSGKCVNLTVTGTKHRASLCENMYVECITNFDFAKREMPFLVKRDEKWFVKLFEPLKTQLNGAYEAGAVDKYEEELWEMAAEEIWFAMEVGLEKQIEYTSLNEFGQHFADFFNVCIAIYDVEVRAKRCHMFSPEKKSPREIVSGSGELNIIHLVYDQGHMHAITNFAAFSKSDMRKDELRLYNYCPICDEKQCNDLRANRQSALDHISGCVCTKDFVINYGTEMEKMLHPNLHQVRKSFAKNSKTNKFECFYQCAQCFQRVEQYNFYQHCCTIQKKKVIEIPEENIYVYDLEAAQIYDEYGLLKHECNCLYIRKVYCTTEEEKQGLYFANEVDFIEFILTEHRFVNAVFVAHNGGSYDVHFLLRILERKEIMHNYVPSPTSKHKFIQIHITHENLNIRFIDFMRFIPGSLKNIAEAFEIPVSKGDFPHKFNNGNNDNYIGPIPPVNSDEDFWGLAGARTQKQKDQFLTWYDEQCTIYCHCTFNCNGQCGLKLWNFQEEIKKYCLLDVVVLAEIVRNYRNACMNFEITQEDKIMNWTVPRLDPLQYMTLPQITINTLVNGFETMDHADYDFKGIVSLGKTQRGGQCWEAILWIYELQQLQSETIYYLGNCLREYYDFSTQFPIDGYCPETGQIYLFLDCEYWGCPMCMLEYVEFNHKLPKRNLYASDVCQMLQNTLADLSRQYRKVNLIWSHEYNTSFKDPKLLEMAKLFSPAECFYGGRTEVFKLYANALLKEKEIHYYDVTSLYPSVYAHHPLPLGEPIHLIGQNIDLSRFHPTASNRYYGFAKISVVPRKSDLIGLLPKRDAKSGRLYFPVTPMTGCWFTTEIYLAMQNGYEVTEVYEIYHWDERNRSDKHLGAYVNYFFQMKQEAEGWKKLGASSEEPSEQEKLEIVERLYTQNGNLGKIRPDKVRKNAVLRALAKLYLNSLWGKLAQKPAKNNHMTIYGNQQLLDLIHNPHVIFESCSFREVSPGVYKSNFKLKDEFIPSVRHGNLFIGAAVTATARCVLHSKMLQVGVENMIYCDTDSIIFYYDPELGILTDVGLGKWTNEYPTSVIDHVYALAPKLYSLKLSPRGKDSYESFRAKGVQLTLINQEKLKFDYVKQLIENIMTGQNNDYVIEVDNMNIFTNSTNNQRPYGQLYTRYNKKKVRAIITKRVFERVEKINWETVDSIQTFPYGYEN